jgi:vitamin B12 transporter
MKRSTINLNARRVCFRKWGNKSYSVFSSLKSLVKIGTISAAYSLIIMPTETIAQPDTIRINQNVEIDEIVITTAQAASTYSELMRAVVVITKEEFSQMPVSNLQDLLENLASVDIRQRGGHGIQADLMIRGGTFDQVLILLNGINISDPQTGHHNLNIPIDLESIDRIEILQGPGTRIFGPGTFSGAINIITSSKKRSSAKAGLVAGNYGLFKSRASASYRKKNNGVFVAASQARSDGYTRNTDFNLYNLFAHSNFEDGTNTLDIQAGYQNKAFGAQSFYTPRFPDQFEQTSTVFASASYSRKVLDFAISPSIYIRNHTDRFELFRNEAPEWYTTHNYHSTLVSGGKIQAVLITDYEKIRLGVEYRSEKILSNVLGENLDSPKPVKGYTDVFFTKGASRNAANIFADYTIYFDPFVVSVGGLISESNDFGNNSNYGVDLSYRAFKNLSFFATVNNAIRFPSFTDLYYQGPTNFGNVNLKPEKATNYEVGAKHHGLIVKSNITLFHRRGKDVIDWVKLPTDARWTTMNHTNINTSGIEAFTSINTRNLLPLVSNISLGYHYMYSDKESGELLSYYTLDYLKHKATFGLSHSIYRGFSATWTAIWQQREGTYTHYPTNIETPYSPFLIANLRANWQYKNLTSFIDIINIGDKRYFDLGNIPQSGRWISVGINYSIN